MVSNADAALYHSKLRANLRSPCKLACLL